MVCFECDYFVFAIVDRFLLTEVFTKQRACSLIILRSLTESDADDCLSGFINS